MSTPDKNPTPSFHRTLPEISVLFSDTVALFKKTAASFLILFLIQTVISIAILVGVGLLGILVGAGTGLASLGTLTSMDAAQATSMVAGLMAGFGVFLVVLLGIFLFIGPAFQASLILLIGKEEGRGDYGKILRDGFRFVGPMLLASLIILFITLGGFFLFVIPGMVIGFLASFTLYEIVLAGKKPLAALYSSINLVSQHFWGVLGRVLLFGLVNFGIFAVAGLIQELLRSSVGDGGVVLINVLFNIAMMPLALVFNLVLYRQVKASSIEKESKPTWIWIVAIIGWLIMLLLGFMIGRGVMEAMRNAENQAQDSEFDWSQMTAEESLMGLDGDESGLASNTFMAINEYREDNNLEALLENPILCYFADLESESSQIPGVYQHLYTPVTGEETSEEVVNEWIASEVVANPPADEAITNPDVTQGCVAVQEDTLVFVGATDSE